jgi:hypothetical protein
MRSLEEFWNDGEHNETVLPVTIISSLYLSDAKGNKGEPTHYGIKQEATEDAHGMTVFKDLYFDIVSGRCFEIWNIGRKTLSQESRPRVRTDQVFQPQAHVLAIHCTPSSLTVNCVAQREEDLSHVRRYPGIRFARA